MKSLGSSLLAIASLSLAACTDQKNADSLARIEKAVSDNTKTSTQRIIALPQTQPHTLTIISTNTDGTFGQEAVVLKVGDGGKIYGTRIIYSGQSKTVEKHDDSQGILAETALNLEKNLPSTSLESTTGIDKK